MNKLGIFGDSFADPNPEEYWDKDKGILPWVFWLSEYMNKKSIIRGRSCSPIWYAFEQFKKYFDECDTIVYVYTNHLRINGLPERYAGLSNINQDWEQNVKSEDYEVAKIIFESRKYLFNENLQLFIYQKVFEEVNELCLKHNKKLVNVLPFEAVNSCVSETREPYPYFADLSKAKFPCLTSLFDVGKEELVRNLKLQEMIIDTRHCHMSPYNNKVMAKIVQETFDKPKDYVYDLFTDNRFRYDLY